MLALVDLRVIPAPQKLVDLVHRQAASKPCGEPRNPRRPHRAVRLCTALEAPVATDILENDASPGYARNKSPWPPKHESTGTNSYWSNITLAMSKDHELLCRPRNAMTSCMPYLQVGGPQERARPLAHNMSQPLSRLSWRPSAPKNTWGERTSGPIRFRSKSYITSKSQPGLLRTNASTKSCTLFRRVAIRSIRDASRPRSSPIDSTSV
mmetsp:Transcript_64947/g.173672  ORF Transcript_64947/g.173672 Transcript_64947/m.173672 type:complete len:209 (+) Transcript_64947:266-892(+)